MRASVPRLPLGNRLEYREGRELPLGRQRIPPLAVQTGQKIVRVAQLRIEPGRPGEGLERLVAPPQEYQELAHRAVDRSVVRKTRGESPVLRQRFRILLVEHVLEIGRASCR